MQTRRSGESVTTFAADGSIDFDFKYVENGRGPTIRARARVAPDGTLASYSAEGMGARGLAIHEVFSLEGGRARWKSLEEAGEATVDGPAFYVPNASSPEILRDPPLGAPPPRRPAAPPACRRGPARARAVGDGDRRGRRGEGPGVVGDDRPRHGAGPRVHRRGGRLLRRRRRVVLVPAARLEHGDCAAARAPEGAGRGARAGDGGRDCRAPAGRRVGHRARARARQRADALAARPHRPGGRRQDHRNRPLGHHAAADRGAGHRRGRARADARPVGHAHPRPFVRRPARHRGRGHHGARPGQ